MNQSAEHLLTRVYTHFLTPDSRTRPAHPDWPEAVALSRVDFGSPAHKSDTPIPYASEAL